jgi:hypothetical protein
MLLIEGEIYCDVHGCVHDQSNDPYGYGYRLSGDKPECEREDWSKIWAGATPEKDK